MKYVEKKAEQQQIPVILNIIKENKIYNENNENEFHKANARNWIFFPTHFA